MRISLPIKLGVFVILLFAFVIATCLLWVPLRIRYYLSKYNSADARKCATGIKGLLSIGRKGANELEKIVRDEMLNAPDSRRVIIVDAFLAVGEKNRKTFINNFPDGEDAARFILAKWGNVARPDKDDRKPPLHIAVLDGYEHAVRLFIAKGADVNAERVLDWHCRKGKERPGSPTGLGIVNSCPLQLAAMRGERSIAEILINRGATIDSKTGCNTPLVAAVDSGSFDIVKLLVDRGASVNFRRRETALHSAARNGHTEIARLLTEHGADVNAMGGSLHPPLHAAAAAWDGKEIVGLLIEKGVDINALDHKNRTALDHALGNSRRVVADLLRAHGGKTGKELEKETDKKK